MIFSLETGGCGRAEIALVCPIVEQGPNVLADHA